MPFINESDLDPISPGGGRFISQADLDPTIEDLLGNDASRAVQGGRLAVGGLTKLLPFGDEIIAGGSSVLDTIRNTLSGNPETLGEAYDRRFKEVGNYQKAFERQSPASSLALGLGGAALLPVGGLAGKATTLPGKLLLSGAEGAGIGGAYGFAEGENLDERLENAKTGALISGVFAPAATAVGQVASVFGTKAKNAAEAILPLSKEDSAIQQLGIGKGLLKKAERWNPSDPLDEPNLIQAVKAGKERGIFSTGTSPGEWLENNTKIISGLNDEASAIVQTATQAQKDLAVPSLDNAKAFAAKHWGEPGLADKAKAYEDLISQHWDGTIQGLNDAKRVFQGIGFSSNSTTTEKKLVRIIAYDLRKSTENAVANTLGQDAAEKLSMLNSMQGEHSKLVEVLEDAKLGGAAKELPQKPSSLTPGLMSGLGVVGSATAGNFNPMLAAIGTKFVEQAANTPAGRQAISATLSKTGNVLSNVPKLAPPATRILSYGTGHVLSSEQEARRDKSDQRQTALPARAASGNQARPSRDPKTDRVGLLSSPNSAPKSVSNQANKSEIDLILDAVKQVESGGRKSAVSTAGAKGPYQLMDATAKDYGVSDVFDEKDARAGAKEKLLDDLTYFNGDMELALAAYNAGRGRVNKLLKQTGGNSYDDIEKKLPSETRNYVPKVADIFAKLLEMNA